MAEEPDDEALEALRAAGMLRESEAGSARFLPLESPRERASRNLDDLRNLIGDIEDPEELLESMTILRRMESMQWANNEVLSPRRGKEEEPQELSGEEEDEKVDLDELQMRQELHASNVNAQEVDSRILQRNMGTVRHAALGRLRKLGGASPSSTHRSPEEIGSATETQLREFAAERRSRDPGCLVRARLAAEYIQDARVGRPTYERSRLGKRVRPLEQHVLFRWGHVVVTLLHMAVVFGEPPSHRSLPNYSQTYLAMRIIEAVCLAWYVFRFVVKLLGTPGPYIRRPWTWCTMVSVAACIVDLVLSFVLPRTPRFSRALRPLLFVESTRRLRDISTTIFRTFLNVLDLVLLFAIVLLLYSIVGTQIYFGTYTDPYENFNAIEYSALTLFVLLTTENYPTILLPAFGLSPWSIVFFGSFLMLGVILLMSVLIAVILDTYKDLRRGTLLKERTLERTQLATAFYILANVDPAREDLSGVELHFEEWSDLISVLKPKWGPNQTRFLFRAVDGNLSGTVDVQEFFEMLDVLLLKFKRSSPGVRNPCRMPHPFIRFTRSKVLRVFIGLVVVANCVLFSIYELVARSGTSTVGLFVVNVLFLVAFVLEGVFKLMAQGPRAYLRDPWQVFDASLTLVSFAGFLVTVIIGGQSGVQFASPDARIRIGVAMMSVTVLRVVSTFEATKLIFKTILKIMPLIFSIFAFVIAVQYVYAVAGVELMALVVPPYNVATRFDTFPHVMLMLFQQLMQNDWHQVMYHAMTNYYAPSISWFFVSYFLIVVFLSMNLTIALIIETFTLQRSFYKVEESLLLEIPGTQSEDDGSLGKRVQYKVWKTLGPRWERHVVNSPNKTWGKDAAEKHAKIADARLRSARGWAVTDQSRNRGKGEEVHEL